MRGQITVNFITRLCNYFEDSGGPSGLPENFLFFITSPQNALGNLITEKVMS